VKVTWRSNHGECRKGKSGFGFDPIFKPTNSDKTFSEMSIAEKNAFSHRAKALRKFAEWYKTFKKDFERIV
jgi:XTP/dITP diphosphohydrolase